MGKRTTTDNKTATPESQPTTSGQTAEARPAKYVVVRDGYRVSDKEYSDPADPAAIAERDFWIRVSKDQSYGEPVEIVQYDSKKHRTW